LESKNFKRSQRTIHQNVSVVQSTSNEPKKFTTKRLSSKKVLICASKLWQDKSIAEAMASEASRIIKTAYEKKSVFFSGKSEKGLLAGIFYLLGRKNKAIKTQREIARSLNTNDVTVRSSYREWIDAFPELFDMKISI
jgi:transcription initiation factor TFIIIB Brf1 subunit/transcription initiation factor TFIIB